MGINIKSVEQCIQNNSKQFWSYIKSKTKSNSLPSYLKYSANTFSTGDSICEAFTDYFDSTFLTSSSNH